MKRLSEATLAEANCSDLPTYERSLQPRIVHLGVGSFARAHLAVYADRLLREGSPFAIHGVSLLNDTAERTLSPQNGLFSVTVREPGVPPSTEVIGSLTRVSTGAPAAVEAIAHPATAMVTLTVTEKAYGDLSRSGPAAVLALALDRRGRSGLGPVVVASLDNVMDNGRVLEKAVKSAADRMGFHWPDDVSDRAVFPSSVVDRMVPAPQESDRRQASEVLGLQDRAAVVSEIHRSWVIERAVGLPPLERVGVEVVDEIGAHQLRKLWLLNGPHSALAYLGILFGHRSIADATTDPRIDDFVRSLIDETLQVVAEDPGGAVDYAHAALARFANPHLGHGCTQVGADGSSKIPQRLLPVMDLRLERKLSTRRHALVVAIWLAAVTRARVGGRTVESPSDAISDRATEVLAADGPGAAVIAALGPAAEHHADDIAHAFERLAVGGELAVRDAQR